jgi:hypothetical protein
MVGRTAITFETHVTLSWGKEAGVADDDRDIVQFVFAGCSNDIQGL